MSKATRKEFIQLLKRFIRVWQVSDSIDAVSRKLQLTTKEIEKIALKCRRNGVEIKKMPRTLVGKRKQMPTLQDRHWKKLSRYVKVQEAV